MPQSLFFDESKDCLDKLPETLLGPVLTHYYQDLSTFSVDPDAVRIEEMINYFDYAYPQPEGDHPYSGENPHHYWCGFIIGLRVRKDFPSDSISSPHRDD